MKPDRILFGFWHGIGDLILATPSFRRYQELHPNTKMSIAVDKTILQSGLLDYCPYFESKLEISNMWLSSVDAVQKEMDTYKKKYGFDQCQIIFQAPYYQYGIHKIERTARELGVYPLYDIQTEVFLDSAHEVAAIDWLEKQNLNQEPFVFLSRKSRFSEKDLPKDIADQFIQKKYPGLPVVEPGISFPMQHINFTFEILRRAARIVVVDSAMLHAADALKKPIDFAYFAMRPGIIDEVRPRNVSCHCVESDAIKKWHLKIRKKVGMQAKWLLNQCLPL